MMKNKNKKGFTLIELLAVIVILAILILIALPQVLRIMQASQKSAFVFEANTILRAADFAWTEESINGTPKSCYNLAYLKTNGYLKKNDPDYHGKVTITMNAGVPTMTIMLSNGKFKTTSATGATADDLADTNTNAVEASSTAVTDTCP